MARIVGFAAALLLGQMVFAAPAEPVPIALAMDAMLVPTPVPALPNEHSSLNVDEHHLELRVPQESPIVASFLSTSGGGSSASSTTSTASSTTSHSTITSSASHQSSSVPSNVVVEALGSFTGLDGNVYGVTSVSGGVLIDGHVLTVGGAAPVIGEEFVTEGSGGLIANGMSVPLTPTTITSTSSVAATTSSTSAVTTSSGTATTTSVGAASSPAGSTSSKHAAATKVAAALPVGAAFGGLVGLLLL